MSRSACALRVLLCLASVASVPAFAQSALSAEAVKTATPATAAYVYVQTAGGVNVYAATMAGKLTPVKGSPFAVAGQIESVNATSLVSVGNTNLAAYAIAAGGAVGKQTANIDTQNFAGSECGTTTASGTLNGAFLDRTGKYAYLQLFGLEYQPGYPLCSAWQSYQLNPAGGKFLGSLDITAYEGVVVGAAMRTTVPVVSSNNKFSYGIIAEQCNCTRFVPFTTGPGGQMTQNAAFTEVDPPTDPSTTLSYFPSTARTDANQHMAVLLFAANQNGWSDIKYRQLASYTINKTTGGIVSTNTWANMPAPLVFGDAMEISPSGKLLAIAGGTSGMPGLQLFHFNGAAPITADSGLLLPSVTIDKLAWDNSNHLYALSYSTQTLYAYTVTPTSITAVAGSPYTVTGAYGIKGLIVVPKL
jgi:hypothetical protein